MKLFKSPERFFKLGMWVISILFCWLMMGLGGLVIFDLHKADREHVVEDFIDPAQLTAARQSLEDAKAKLDAINPKVEDAQSVVRDKQQALKVGREQHDERLRQRRATGDNKAIQAYDQELRQQGQANEALSNEVAQLQDKLNVLREEQRLAQREHEDLYKVLEALRRDAMPQLDEARARQELRVFGWRLLVTLPLLLVSVWLVRRKRQSPHWPLLRGFVLFSVYAFFFELVPYMPSWGGYIRYLVGLVLTIFGGHWGIRWMQAYVARRAEEEKRNEAERRVAIDDNAALVKMAASVCPGCERTLPPPNANHETNHCVHCGLTLFNRCTQPAPGATEEEGRPLQLCGVRKNAFYRHCPTCGGAARAA